jgi:uncharacterized coiled-coil protein SlyX
MNPVPDPVDDLSRRLQRLEETVCHDQRLIETLNQVIIDLRQTLERMQLRLAVAERRQGLLDQRLHSQEENLPHEKPPHY